MQSITPSSRYKFCNGTSKQFEKKMAKRPVEIGTRGTFGFLVMREIEYFSQLELGSDTPSWHWQLTPMGRDFRPKLGSNVATPKTKKTVNNKKIPRMCSMVEVVEMTTHPNLTSRFPYKNLKAEVKNSHLYANLFSLLQFDWFVF
jgi:hypothetical protein